MGLGVTAKTSSEIARLSRRRLCGVGAGTSKRAGRDRERSGRRARCADLRKTPVAGGGPNRNSQQRLDRLVSAWEQGDRGGSDESCVVEQPDPEVVLNPSRRNRTPLTAREVEAIQTARENGESVLSIAKRFNIHRVTVWEHTKTASGSDVR